MSQNDKKALLTLFLFTKNNLLMKSYRIWLALILKINRILTAIKEIKNLFFLQSCLEKFSACCRFYLSRLAQSCLLQSHLHTFIVFLSDYERSFVNSSSMQSRLLQLFQQFLFCIDDKSTRFNYTWILNSSEEIINHSIAQTLTIDSMRNASIINQRTKHLQHISSSRNDHRLNLHHLIRKLIWKCSRHQLWFRRKWCNW